MTKQRTKLKKAIKDYNRAIRQKTIKDKTDQVEEDVSMAPQPIVKPFESEERAKEPVKDSAEKVIINFDSFKEQMLWRLEKFEVYKMLCDFAQIVKTLDRLLGGTCEAFEDGEIEMIDFTTQNHEAQFEKLTNFQQLRSYLKQYKLEISLTYQAKVTAVLAELKAAFEGKTAMMSDYRLLAKVSKHQNIAITEEFAADLCENIESVPQNCKHFVVIVKFNQLLTVRKDEPV